MIGTVFEEDGEFKILVKLGKESWPFVKRFRSVAEMLKSLEVVAVPPDQIMDFVFAGLQSKGKLMSLPGCAHDWVQFVE